MKTFLIHAPIWLICLVLLTTVPATHAEQMQTYTVADGLVAPVVPVIFQDSRGILWFGSNRGGVTRFDGNAFVAYVGRREGTVTDEQAERIVFQWSSDGRTQGPAVAVAPGALLGYTQHIVEDKWGHIWFLSRVPGEAVGRVTRFDGKVFEPITTGNALLADRRGDIWVAGGDGVKLVQYTTTGVQQAPQPQSFPVAAKVRPDRPSWQNPLAINVLFESAAGYLWLGGSDGENAVVLRVHSETGETQAFDSVSAPTLQYGAAIHAIAQDASETLWFGGENFLIRLQDETFERIHPRMRTRPGRGEGRGEAPPPPRAQRREGAPQTPGAPASIDRRVSLQSDTKGRIWFSARGNLRQWDGTTLRPLRTVTDGEGNVRPEYLRGFLAMEDRAGNLWFAGQRGAHQYDATLAPTDYYADDGLGSDRIFTIFEAIDGTLWFGHDNGVTAYNPRPAMMNYSTRAGTGGESVRHVYEDSRGRLWFSIPGGVALYDAAATAGEGLAEEGMTALSTHRLRIETSGEPRRRRAASAVGRRRAENFNNFRRRTEIIKIFEVDEHVWFINRPAPGRDATRYTFFRHANGKFDQVSLSIAVEIGPGGERLNTRNVEVLLSEGEKPWLALGGSLFKPDATGLQWLSPKAGFIRVLFQQTREMRHAPSAITSLHKDKLGRLWCHFDNGKVKRYPASLDSAVLPSGGRNLQPETLPLNAAVLVHTSSPETLGSSFAYDFEIKWFFSSATGKLTRWMWTERDGERWVETEHSARSLPVAAWQTRNASEGMNPLEVSQEVAFLFEKQLTTYRVSDDETTAISNSDIDIVPARVQLATKSGELWLATERGAVKYDGKNVMTYATAKDGFLVDDVRDVKEDSWGNIWFATWGGGVVRYDGERFYVITTKDGLRHNNVSQVYESKEKEMWFATEGGATRYTPAHGGLPFCRLASIEADRTYSLSGRAGVASHLKPSGYGDVDEIAGVTLPARADAITIDFQGISPLREALGYQFKLVGLDTNAWTDISAETVAQLTEPAGASVQTHQPVSYGGITQQLQSAAGALQVHYEGLKSGTYTFLIKALRDGTPYTQRPAVLNVTIAQPFWTKWRSYLPTLIFITAVITLLVRLYITRRRTMQLQAEVRKQEEAEIARIRAELDEAQTIQMALLPEEAPAIPGFDVAGMSVPAKQVGGDFFDYLTVANGQTAIAVADAAGKGLRGAMSAVLTNGMLYEVTRFRSEADVILHELNIGLAPRLYGPSFIALNLIVLDAESGQIDYANGGQPYPLLKRGAETSEIESSDLPLGSMRRARYDAVSFTLEEGDAFIFHTDGIIEALDAEDEMYGTERLMELVSDMPADYTAEEIINRIVEDVHEFVGETEQYDDLTLVVLKRAKGE